MGISFDGIQVFLTKNLVEVVLLLRLQINLLPNQIINLQINFIDRLLEKLRDEKFIHILETIFGVLIWVIKYGLIKVMKFTISFLKLVSVIFYQIFIFSPNVRPSKTMKNVFLFHRKSSFRFRDIQFFVIFSLLFHTFQIQKGEWKWNNLCHKLSCIKLQI